MPRNNRKPGRPRELADPRDLYLRWAIATEFEYVFQQDGSVGLLILWKSTDAAALAVSFIPEGASVPGVYLAPRGKEKRVPPFWVMTIPVDAVSSFIGAVANLAVTIELAAPVSEAEISATRNLPPVLSGSETLMAVLDDGCAFANARFRTTTGTRILWLWNQDIDAAGAPLDGTWPSANVTFGYGGQWSNADLDSFFPAAGGTQEEAYRRAGLASLRRSATHGTHVMDLLAGKDATDSELWDIVFVQFPKSGIDDPSGVWLKRFAADGLFYITECAGAATKTIVANLSWGPQTGPHDGSYALEQAIEWLIQEQADNHDRKLIVTLAAGNSFSARAHACVSYAQGGTFDWILPPDGEIPAFIELWWPETVVPAGARLRIVPPGGPSTIVTPGIPTTSDGSWTATIGQIGAWTTALLVVNPTGGKQGQKGRHGRWRIIIDATPLGVDGDIDIYVARADHNMGARRRAKASYLTDDALEMQRFVAPSERYKEAPGSAIRRAGTLSGIATGPSPEVAAGYVLKTEQPAPYSSSGRSRGTRVGPDYALMTDRSEARAGVRASGVRTGTKVRLVGTSAAAPQLGRRLIEGVPKVMPTDPERTGKGEIPPGDLIGPE